MQYPLPSHVRKVLSQPELSIVLINKNSDSNDVASARQYILSMPVIGGLLAHHSLMQAQRPIDRLVASFSDVFCRPGPPDALLAFTIT